jgi:hypothetical protein
MDDTKFDPEKELRKLLPELHDDNGNFTLPTSIESEPKNKGSDSWQYGVVGAPVGAIAGKIFSGVKPPVFSTKEVDVAQTALQKAETAVAAIRNAIETHQNAPRPQLQVLEQEYIRRQQEFMLAEQNLNRATVEAAAVPRDIPARAPTATVQTPESLVPTPEQHSRGLQGTMKEVQGGPPITGRASMNTFNENTSFQALSKTDQERKLAQLVSNGLITPEGANEIRLKLGKVAATPSGVAMPARISMDNELRASQAASEASKQDAVRRAEIERLRQEQALARRNVGEARATMQEANRPVTSATNNLTGKLSSAEITAQIAAAEAARAAAAAPEEGALKKVGRFISGSPKLAGMLGGAGVGMSVAEAMDRFNSGDTSGGVISTLAAAFGGMSMVPPVGPAGLAVKGIGTVGGLATIPAIMLNDYLKGR